jgi:hypothetical protein
MAQGPEQRIGLRRSGIRFQETIKSKTASHIGNNLIRYLIPSVQQTINSEPTRSMTVAVDKAQYRQL